MNYIEKMQKTREYKNTVLDNHGFFKQFYYYSIIDNNLIKLESILKNGINYDNSTSQVSLVEYTDESLLFNYFKEYFAQFTLSSLSLMIDKKNILKSNNKSENFFDVIFSSNSISNTDIKGIILPSYLVNKNLSEISPLSDNISCYTDEYLSKWITEIELYFKQNINKEIIIKYLKELKILLEEHKHYFDSLDSSLKKQKRLNGYNLNDILANIINKLWEQKLELQNPKYIDVVKTINNNRYPIYEIGQMQLKKVK